MGMSRVPASDLMHDGFGPLKRLAIAIRHNAALCLSLPPPPSCTPCFQIVSRSFWPTGTQDVMVVGASLSAASFAPEGHIAS